MKTKTPELQWEAVKMEPLHNLQQILVDTYGEKKKTKTNQNCLQYNN